MQKTVKKFIKMATVMAFMAMPMFVQADPDPDQTDNAVSYEDIFNFDGFDSTSLFFDINLDTAPESGNFIDPDEVIAYAKQYLGRPYVWGGKGPNVFDCSGFTSYVYRKFNISLSPVATYQIDQGERVARNDIRPGDLLFFRGINASNPVIGHVALAIDVDPSGEVTFIHAASSSVRIDVLEGSAYYKSRYVGACRVI